MFLIRLSRIFEKGDGHLFKDNFSKKVFVTFLKDMRKNFMFWVFIAFGIGIIINEQVRPSVWIGFYGSACGIIIMLRLRVKSFLVVLLITLIFLGMLYCRAASVFPQDHIFYVAKKIDWRQSFFEGRAVGDVKKVSALGGYEVFEFKLKRVVDQEGRGRNVSGQVVVRAFKQQQVEPGDYLGISGTLHKPFEFGESTKVSYRAYLKRKKIYFLLSVGRKGRIKKIEKNQSFVVRIRERFKKVFDQYMPEFDAGILKAIIFGDRTQIDRNVRDVFARTGTAHVLAISGLHMGIILMIFLFVLGVIPISQKIKFMFAILLLICYLPLAGGRVSVLRSGIMSALFLYSFIVERRLCSLNALGVAGLSVLLMNPLDLYEIGFQLSFSAVVSLILFYSHIMGLMEKMCGYINKIVVQSFAASLAAWLGVLGLVVYYFGMFTPIGLIVNVFVVLVIPALIACGMLLASAGFLGMKGASALLAANIKVFLRILVFFIAIFDQIPFGNFSGINVSGIMCLSYYGFLCGAVLVIKVVAIKKAL